MLPIDLTSQAVATNAYIAASDFSTIFSREKRIRTKQQQQQEEKHLSELFLCFPPTGKDTQRHTFFNNSLHFPNENHRHVVAIGIGAKLVWLKSKCFKRVLSRWEREHHSSTIFDSVSNFKRKNRCHVYALRGLFYSSLLFTFGGLGCFGFFGNNNKKEHYQIVP